MHAFWLEDDDNVFESIERFFELRGWDCTRATTMALGRALLAVPPAPYDCAVLDLNLPDGKGVHLLVDANYPDIPTALYSGLPENAKAELAKLDALEIKTTETTPVVVFSKGDPFGLLKWLEAVADV